MPVFRLGYGDTSFSLTVPAGDLVAEVRANAVDLPALSPEQAVREALAHPVASPPLEELVRAGHKVCLLVPDVTRLWQSPAVSVPLLVEALNACGARDGDITILSACGTHRRQTPEEHAALVGRDIAVRIPVVDHQCRETAELRRVGVTSRGTPVDFNRHVVEADKVVSCCGVVHHFLAGFGGGGKMLLPGVAGHASIQHNHGLALNEGFGAGANPGVRSGNLGPDNPFHADIVEAASLCAPCFSLNVVVDDRSRIIKAFAGDWRAAHEAACKLVAAMDGVPVPRRAPLVVASAGGAPKDINLYQAVKLLANALAAAEPGGAVILLARCPEGFGNDECRKQIQDYADMKEREKALRAEFSIGAYAGFLFAAAAERHTVVLVTDMKAEDFSGTRIRIARNLDDALTLARGAGGAAMPVTVMPHGATTVPMPRA